MKYLLFLCLFLPVICRGQISLSKDEKLMALIRQGTDRTNNFDFAEADKIYNQLDVALPNHPVVPLLKGLNLYWQYLPMPANHPQYPNFVAYMNKTMVLAQKILRKDGDNAEAVFFELTARSLLMQQYSKEGQTMKAVGEARTAYSQIKKGFDLKESFNEFYLTTGMYNYYREAYPEAKPIYKPFAFFFQSGDKKLGLEQLVYASRHCSIVNTQALLFLTDIYMIYENSPGRASLYAAELVSKYPRNGYYVARYTETLLALKQYDRAAPYVQQLLKQNPGNKYIVMIGQVFAGVLEEHKHKNMVAARSLYNGALAAANQFGSLANNYKAYAYMGLSRIYAQEKNHEQSKQYLKLARDTAEYPSVLASTTN